MLLRISGKIRTIDDAEQVVKGVEMIGSDVSP